MVLGKCVVGVSPRVGRGVAVLCWWCVVGRLAVVVEGGMRKRWGRALAGSSCGGRCVRVSLLPAGRAVVPLFCS